MKKTFYLFLSALAFIGCENNGKENERILSESSGNINNISVVIENDLWQGEVGEAIREEFAFPYYGLPRDEPTFSLSQMPPQAFSGFARRNRTFLRIEKGTAADIKIGNDLFASPQTGIVVTGETNEEIISLLDENAEGIIKALKQAELREQQRRIGKSLTDDSRLREELGVSLQFPSAYRYAKDEDGFFWIRKDIPNGSMEILVYEVPLNVIHQDSNIIGNIIEMRDSIGEQHIPGPSGPGTGSYMITEAAYAPYLFNAEIDDKFAYETRGTWDVTKAFMGGPFLNYAVLDEENDRFIVLEGFSFEPSASLRDNMFELEAILRSAEIE